MPSGTGTTWERIVQIRPAVSPQTHLWPPWFNCAYTTSRKKIGFKTPSLRSSSCRPRFCAPARPRSAASQLNVVKVWRKWKARVPHKLLSAIPPLKPIPKSESQLGKPRSCGVTQRLKRPEPARTLSEDQLQCNDKGMWLGSDYYMELWTLIRTNQFESRMSALFYLKL